MGQSFSLVDHTTAQKRALGQKRTHFLSTLYIKINKIMINFKFQSFSSYDSPRNGLFPFAIIY